MGLRMGRELNACKRLDRALFAEALYTQPVDAQVFVTVASIIVVT